MLGCACLYVVDLLLKAYRKRGDQRIWWKKTKKYKISHFAHIHASEAKEGEKEVLLKTILFDIDWRMALCE